MRRSKIVLLIIGLMFVTKPILAQTPTQQLVVWQKSGEKVYINLTEEPETTFEEGNLVIKTKTTTISYSLEDVLRYTYEGPATAISAPKLQPNEIIFSQQRDQMTFEGLPDGAQITIYSTDGQQITTQTVHNGQPSVVSFAGLPAGIYIVKTGDATYKFLKR